MRIAIFNSSTAAIDKKIVDLKEKHQNRTAEQTTVRQHISTLEADLKHAEREALLEDSAEASKRAADLRSRIGKLRPKDEELSRELRILEDGQSELQARRDAAGREELIADFQDKCSALLVTAKEMDSLLATLGRKVTEARSRTEALQAIALPHTNGHPDHIRSTCNDSLRDALIGALRAHMQEVLPHLVALGCDFATNGVISADKSFSKYLESRLQSEANKLRMALSDRDARTGDSSAFAESA